MKLQNSHTPLNPSSLYQLKKRWDSRPFPYLFWTGVDEEKNSKNSPAAFELFLQKNSKNDIYYTLMTHFFETFFSPPGKIIFLKAHSVVLGVCYRRRVEICSTYKEICCIQKISRKLKA